MRILVLNPNTSADITARLSAAAQTGGGRRNRHHDSDGASAAFPISRRARRRRSAAPIALEMLAELHRDCDAAIVAAFGDPGLFGARELFDIPVVGMAEASMLTACMLGRRFAIVTFARALGPWYQECVDMHGLTGVAPASACSTIRSTRSATCRTRRKHLLVELAGRAAQDSKPT